MMRMMVACRVCLCMMMGMACTVVVRVPVDFFSFKGVRKPVYQCSGACAKNIDAKHDEQEICGGFFHATKGVYLF